MLPSDVCRHVKPTLADKSRAGIGFRGAGGDKIQHLGKRESQVQVSDGMVFGSTWQMAGVKRPLMNPRVVFAKGKVVPLRQAGNVFLIDLGVRGLGLGFARQG